MDSSISIGRVKVASTSLRGRHPQHEANKRNDCQAQLCDSHACTTESFGAVRAITTRKVAPNVRTMPVLGQTRMVAIHSNLIKVTRACGRVLVVAQCACSMSVHAFVSAIFC